MERNGATVYGPSVRAVGATAARMLRAELRTFVSDQSLSDSLPAFLHHRLAR